MAAILSRPQYVHIHLYIACYELVRLFVGSCFEVCHVVVFELSDEIRSNSDADHFVDYTIDLTDSPGRGGNPSVA